MKIKNIISKQKRNKLSLMKSQLLSVIAPKYNTKRLYEVIFGNKLSLKNPKSLNEKIQYLKLNDYYNNNDVTECIDKYLVRNYVHKLNLDEILPELYGAFDTTSDIDWNSLPKKFVVKCNHGSGYVYLCNDKSKLNVNRINELINSWMKEDYWKKYSETQYKYIKKKIIIEEHLGDNIDTYKFYCAHGKVKLLHILSTNKESKEEYIDFYDKDFNNLENIYLDNCRHNSDNIVRPSNLNQLIEIAEQLSSEFPFVRVDLYNIDNKPYLSELTFVPFGGFMRLEPKELDRKWGEWVRI